MKQLVQKLYSCGELSQEEVVHLLHNLGPESRDELFRYAHMKRIERYGDKVFMRGLIEFSSFCRQNCLYCGLRASNVAAERYRLQPVQILDCCQEGYDLGFRTFVLQSGEDYWYTETILVDLVRSVKVRFPDTALTLSIGERDEETYQSLYEAGADRFLLRHETASRNLYKKLHPTMSFDNRRKCLATLQRIGYQVGAGFMVGLPGQTVADLAEDLLYLRALNPDMIGIGPFIPHDDTPLRDESAGSLEDTLVMVALARLFVPDALIPATTALGSLDVMGRERALKVGANVVMPNLSPVTVRKKYALYNNKICTGEESAECRHCLELRIRAAGFFVDMGRGDSLKSVTVKP
ncbi:[FeFe] hydrogenase H-cluster radical SAM maturase HydE [Paenibacillus segetis]|uniref:[FeFe] hydrogenase H-cluster radical SAM maturase HydE n=1 Tax=Paenibacillus segetis TaxID=1325360 RepID=A0ABQ1YUW5_9BACL|nr:[FeFe] hydrogenase H-cluster radical SAM maturase HydE [Paenibacillus segetis]GGH39702.1 [FeFe] hydrogenase H-cluster radical SAM maturase HydE [Paenibacillus segetis]